MRPRAGAAVGAARRRTRARVQLRRRRLRVSQRDPRAPPRGRGSLRKLLLRARPRHAPVPSVRALRPRRGARGRPGVHAPRARGGEPRAMAGGAATRRAGGHSRVRESQDLLGGGGERREGGPRLALLDAGALDELARHDARARRPPGGRARRGARRPGGRAARAAARHELAQARAEPHRRRLRLSRPRRRRGAHGVGSQRPLDARRRLLRRAPRALRREPGVRHAGGAHPRVQDVLLVALVMAMRAAAGEDVAAPPRWYAHRFNRAGVYRAASVVAAALPRPARLRVAAAVAGLVAPRLAVERAVVRRNLSRIVPEAAPDRLDALVADVFRHFAVCFADLLTSNRGAHLDALVAGVEGMAALEEAAAANRGLVVLTAHLGNWELAGRLLARHGARPTHVVVAAEADPAVERFLRGGEAPVRFVTRTAPTA